MRSFMFVLFVRLLFNISRAMRWTKLVTIWVIGKMNAEFDKETETETTWKV
jgi:hypothetical protein